jgi:acyl-CoA hydrolase
MNERHRTVSESQAERSEVIFPGDANSLGNLFGGRLMQFIDLVGAVAAYRHAGSKAVVTASMDSLDFVAPVHIGDVLILKASVNRAFKTSMEVGVKAMVENLRTREMRHVSSAYVTYVAMDEKGLPQLVDPIVPETEHQKRRYEDALRRREGRADETMRKREMRKLLATTDWHP